MGIVLVSPPRGPECAGVLDRQVGRLMGKTGREFARSRVVLVTASKPRNKVADDSNNARTIDLKIPMEGAQEELAFPAVLDVGVPKIELQLSVNIRQVELGNSKERTFCLLFAYKGVPAMGV